MKLISFISQLQLVEYLFLFCDAACCVKIAFMDAYTDNPLCIPEISLHGYWTYWTLHLNRLYVVKAFSA